MQSIEVNIELLSDHPPLLNSEIDGVVHHLVNHLRRLRSEKCNIKIQQERHNDIADAARNEITTEATS